MVAGTSGPRMKNRVLDLAGHLPSEAAEALLELATGGTPQVPGLVVDIDPFDHPDAQRRFRIMRDWEELERALDYPWDKWAVFLHPAQRGIVERDYAGPARVSGSAGTGKTIVALQRAVHLARMNPNARVLLTTFSETLANALRDRLRILISLGAPDRRAGGSLRHRRTGRTVIPPEHRRSIVRFGSADCSVDRGGGAYGQGDQVLAELHANRVEPGSRCMAAGYLGSLPRCPAPRPQAASAREPSPSALVDLRTGALRT